MSKSNFKLLKNSKMLKGGRGGKERTDADWSRLLGETPSDLPPAVGAPISVGPCRCVREAPEVRQHIKPASKPAQVKRPDVGGKKTGGKVKGQ